MKFHILTLFPDFFTSPLQSSVVGKAIEKKIVKVELHNFRDFATDKHNTADDYPFGGGAGMILKPEPIFNCYENLVKNSKSKFHTVFFTPTGKPLNQKKVRELKEKENLIILCGHYKGLDQRVIDELVDEEISLGDFILTGGEIPALTLVDSVTRLVPGVLGNIDSANTDSFENEVLDYPHYTRPANFKGIEVPEVLLSGHHENIKKWRNKKSLEITKKNRPDLLEN
ncbi:MAG: tRNA (guanosine(37)-N1)-methyltransferase TrmD [Calditrichaeota bacterium]|nr:MAG: tRNA (guanosine(37)-N1)-methyltransferase TrmD [Calditrichota bacterium]